MATKLPTIIVQKKAGKYKASTQTFKMQANGKAATGNPRTVEIDLEKVKLFSRFQPTDSELAAALGIPISTLINRKNADVALVEAIEFGKAHGRLSIRGKQYDLAMKGNAVMLIWAGKQYLDQKEKQEMTGKDGKDLYPQILTREELIIQAQVRGLPVSIFEK